MCARIHFCTFLSCKEKEEFTSIFHLESVAMCEKSEKSSSSRAGDEKMRRLQVITAKDSRAFSKCTYEI